MAYAPVRYDKVDSPTRGISYTYAIADNLKGCSDTQTYLSRQIDKVMHNEENSLTFHITLDTP